jgi:imidazolonepropionase-like amidohydrolase
MPGFVFALAAAVAASDTTSYVVLNHGRPAGEMLVITTGDTLLVKYHHVDRQRGPRSETRYVVRNGVVMQGESWSLPLRGPEPTPRPAPGDRFEIVRDSFTWRSRDSVRSAPRTSSTYYRLRGAPYDQLLLTQFLLKQPNRTAQILPSGTATLQIVADTVVRTRTGRTRARLAMIEGTRGIPSGVWIDDRNEMIAGEAAWFIAVRRGSEELLPALRALEFRYRNGQGEALGKRLAPAPAKSIAIVNGDVFDADRGVMLPRHTVIVRGDRVVSVGPSAAAQVPSDATVIDAAGKTVMPGLWDMHSHVFLTSQLTRSVSDLAGGITTIRDMASDLDMAVSLRDRSDAGILAAPRVILGGFIEGPGLWAGPSEAIATTEAEARAWVKRYADNGFKQIKLYNLVQQDLIPAIADETHKRGMRLSGHIPRGLSVPAAIRLGFDEINHAAFLFSTFHQDSLYIPTMRAYSTVSQIVAPNTNVDGPEVTAMIDLFKEKGTVIDGTWQLWMSSRNATAAAVGIPTAADSVAQRLDAAYLRMLKRLFDAGVPLVPGTDGSSFNGELELYERAGIPPAEVLRIATIVSAKAMGDDKTHGSIAPGKVADIIIVDGRPAERVADLRKVERVMRAGRLYDVRALQAATQ